MVPCPQVHVGKNCSILNSSLIVMSLRPQSSTQNVHVPSFFLTNNAAEDKDYVSHSSRAAANHIQTSFLTSDIFLFTKTRKSVSFYLLIQPISAPLNYSHWFNYIFIYPKKVDRVGQMKSAKHHAKIS